MIHLNVSFRVAKFSLVDLQSLDRRLNVPLLLKIHLSFLDKSSRISAGDV